jgi:hypothetical protein
MFKIEIILLVSLILLSLIIFYNKSSENQKELYINITHKGIVATLDSNNKVVNINSKLSNDDNTKIMNYYNQNGVLRVKINIKKIDLLIDKYVKILSNNSQKIIYDSIKNLKKNVSSVIKYISYSGLALVINDENPKANEKEEQIEIIIPKILLSQESNQFIDFVSKMAPLFNKDLVKIIYDSMKDILNKIASESNPEVRISNLISLVMRTSIILSIMEEIFMAIDINDRSKILTYVFFDLLNLIPMDRCIFNENNEIEFDPNVCNIKQNKQEECPKCVIPECPECKKTECNCPECQECKKTVCPECPTCPECKKTECNCPECKKTVCPECPQCPELDRWDMSRILNVILTSLLIIFVVLYGIK